MVIRQQDPWCHEKTCSETQDVAVRITQFDPADRPGGRRPFGQIVDGNEIVSLNDAFEKNVGALGVANNVEKLLKPVALAIRGDVERPVAER